MFNSKVTPHLLRNPNSQNGVSTAFQSRFAIKYILVVSCQSNTPLDAHLACICETALEGKSSPESVPSPSLLPKVQS